MHAAIYLRVSTEEQVEGYSLAEQERQCRAYCAARGWTDVQLYADEGMSAFRDRIEDRPQLAAMLRDVRLRRVQAVVVHKLDRFFRRAKLLIATVEELIDQRGIPFVSVSEQIDFATPAGRVMLANLGAFAEYYSRNLSLETKKGLAGKARAGDWVGPVPFGYVRDGKTLAPSGDAWVVIRIFTFYATGEHSYTTIADDLNQEGLRLRHWRDGLKRFGRESIRSILGNDAYVGQVRCKGITAAGRHPPLIGRDLWEQCQAIRERRDRTNDTPALRGAGGLLSELAFCATCGARLWAHRSGRKGTAYYRCAHRREYGDSACASRMIKADAADRATCDLVRACTIPPAYRECAIALAQAQLQQTRQQPTHDPVRVQRQLARLRAAFLDGDPDLTEAVYFAEKRRLEGLLVTTPAPPLALDIEQAMRTLADLGSALDAAPPSERRMLIQVLIRAVWLDRTRGVTQWMPTPRYATLVEAAAVLGDGCLTGDEATSHTLAIPPRVHYTTLQYP